MQPNTDRRRPLLARTEVLLPAKLLQDGEPDRDLRLMNLSAAGFMAECLEPVQVGANVVISVPGAGQLPAEIRWNENSKIGGIFHFELSARELGLFQTASDHRRRSQESVQAGEDGPLNASAQA
jgi:hypothetical protein